MKLQPNFSWQKYEGDPEDQRNQFQYQLQNQHVLVSNAINSTINDLSFFTSERMTGFTWTDNKAIWTKTLTGTLSSGPNNIAHGITKFSQIIDISGSAQDAIPFSTQAIPLPYVSITALNQQIEIEVTATNIVITVGAASPGINYLFQVTLRYTKTK